MKNRILSLFIVIVMLLTLAAPVTVFGSGAESEACGNNLLWTLDADGTLTISGEGDMWDKTAFVTQLPWEATGIPLKKVIVEEGVTSIGSYVFYNTDVTSVTLPNTLTKIREGAFKWCSSLEEINLPDSITDIEPDAFYLTSIKELVIPKGLKVIKKWAFSNAKIKKLTIPEGVTEIQDNAFESCKELTEIVFPSTLKVIHNYAFQWCEALPSVTIPNGVTTLGEGAFYYCKNLNEITLPDGITNFGNSNSLNATSYDGTHAFLSTGYAKNESNWEDGILYIGNYLIDVNTDITGEVVVKEGIKYITDMSFYRCKNITKVTLPDSVEDIYCRTFVGCSSLAEIEFGTEIRHIGKNAFDSIPFYTNTDNWTDGILYAGRCLVKAESDVGEVVVKDETLSIADYAFAETTLSKITLPESVKHIGNYAFEDCGSLTEITLSQKTETIGDYAFLDCKVLGEIAIPDTAVYLGEGAFQRCSALKKATLGIGLTEIKDVTFQQSGLFAITIPGSVKAIGSSAFSSCEELESLIIPNSVETIDDWAFYSCSSLMQVNIPDGVTYIGAYSFSGLNSETITIGKGLKTIGGTGAFVYNHNLKEFIVDEENSVYSSQNGVLFNKDKTLLMQYPIGKEDTDYTVPDGVVEIGVGAMFQVELQSLTIADTVKIIGQEAFNSGTIYSVNLGEGVEVIGYGAFSNVWYLEEIIIPHSVKEIGDMAFSSVDLSYVTLGSGVEKIGDSAFSGCSIHNIQLPDSLLSIGEKAFEGCKYLNKIIIPKNVISIGECAFRNCTGLYSIGVDEENTQYCSIDESLYSKDKKTLLQYPPARDEEVYTLPEGVENVGDYAMYNCGNLETIILPQGLIFIGENAFANCKKLTTLYIPESATETGKATFVDNCKSFGSIYYGGDENQWKMVDYYSKLANNTAITIHYAYKYFTEDTQITYDGETTSAYITPAEELNGKYLVFALYQGNTLTGVGTAVCQNELIDLSFTDPHNKIKILYWDDLSLMEDFTDPEVINTQEWGNEE